MSSFKDLQKQLLKIVTTVSQNEIKDPSIALQKVTIQLVSSPYGEIKTNIALIYAQQSNLTAYQAAKLITTNLTSIQEIEKGATSASGLIYLTMKSSFWHSHLKEILKADYQQFLLKNTKILEYMLPNTLVPLNPLKSDSTLLNPFFLMQYTLTRCHSIVKYFKEIYPTIDLSEKALIEADVTKLIDESELALLRFLAYYSAELTYQANTLKPKQVFHQLQILVNQFQILWNKSRKNTILRFIAKDDLSTSFTRIALIKAMMLMLEHHFQILGISPLKEIY